MQRMQKRFSFIFTVLCFMLCIAGFAQSNNESFYVFKEDWSPAPSLESCTYFMHEVKKGDSEYGCRYYTKNGPMIKQETYKDAELKIPNGRFCWYNEKGKIDSCGLVKNLRKDGNWDYYLGDSIRATYFDEYDNGKFIKRDVTADTGITKPDADTSSKTFTTIQIAAQFQNGSKGWVKYLEKNVETPARFSSIFSSGVYTITVCFLIDKQGHTGDIYLRKSIEWSADKEVFNIIEKSPPWKPAVQNGRVVNYRQLENISFAVN